MWLNNYSLCAPTAKLFATITIMNESYNRSIATHYSSYRPPLHQTILKRVFDDQEVFLKGLDVGCGTGYSAAALSDYCLHVYGIDPSQSMLDDSTPHEKISFLRGRGEELPLADRLIDAVTFAGSLFYAKSNALIDELKRVCVRSAPIVAYDFEVLFGDILKPYEPIFEANDASYDHKINFSDSDDFEEIHVGRDQIEIIVSASELTHLLLSGAERFELFKQIFKTSEPFSALRKELQAKKDRCVLDANIYYARYQLRTK